MNDDSSESEEICIKRTRLPRRQTTVQYYKKFCAKDEKNASIKKVWYNFKHGIFEISNYLILMNFRYHLSFKR